MTATTNVSIKPAGDNAGNNAVDECLSELLKLWRQYERRGLEVRHKTGLSLNRKFGSPSVRQAYGTATLKRYSARLHVAESELSRMRWFAEQFGSLADLKAKHPKVKTWTQVKGLAGTCLAFPAASRLPRPPATCSTLTCAH